jgi:MFS family permease
MNGDRAAGRDRTAYVVLLALAGVDAAAYSVIAPVVPAIAEETAAGPGAIGALVATFGVGMAIGFALAGRGVQARHASFVLAGSVALMAAGSAGFVVGGSFTLYVVSRLLMGIGSGGFWIGVTFATLERFPGQEYRRLTGILAASSIGSLAGPAFGAIGGIRGPFAAYLVLVVVAGVAVFRLGAPRERPTFSSDRRALRHPAFWLASAMVLLVALALGTLEGPLPLHFAERLGQREIGAMYVATSLVVALSAAVAGRLPPRPIVAFATVLVVGGVSLAGASDSVPLWGVALLLSGVGFGLGEAAAIGILLGVVGPERIVLAMVVFSQVWALGYLAGPAAGGGVAEAFGFAAIGVVPLTCATLVAVAFVRSSAWQRAYARS